MHQPLNFMKLITDPANRPALRSALAQHDAMLVLSDDLQTVLWANDEGAQLLGEDQACAIIAQSAQLSPQTIRQVLALDLSAAASHNIMLRFNYGLHAALHSCVVTPLYLNESTDKALLISTAARNKAVPPALPDHHAVELQSDGSSLHQNADFLALDISVNTLADLMIEAQDAEDGMVSRRVRAGQRTVQALLIILNKNEGTSLFLTPKAAQMQDHAQGQNALTFAPELTTEAPAEPAAAELQIMTPEVKAPLDAAHFVWKTSADGHFTEISAEFATIVGNNAADIIGRKFSDVAQVFGFDADTTVTKLLKQHETWSGKRIFWPVEGTDQRIPVDLAAVPIFDRDKNFNGFSGFGVLHPALTEKDPESIGLALVSGPVKQKEHTEAASIQPRADKTDRPATPPIASPSEKIILMEALRASQQRQEQVSEKSETEPQAIKPSAQITDIRPARSENGLSQTERNAFREIADRLRREVLQKSPQSTSTKPASLDAEKTDNDTPVHLIAPAPEPVPAKQTETEHPELPLEALVDIPYPHDVVPANFNHVSDHAERPAPALSDADKQNEDLHMLNGLPVPVLIHSADRLHFANPAFFTMTGYQSLDDLLQAGGIDALFAPSTDSDISGMILRLADGSEKIVEAHLQSVPWQGARALMLSLLPELVLQADNDDRADNTPRKADLKVVPVVDNPVHQMQSELALHSAEPAINEDIKTADIAANHELPDLRALQTQIDELTSILDTATDGVVILGQDGKIRSLNQSAAALFGYDTNELTDKSFAVLFAIESQRAAIDYIHGLSGDGVASLLNDGREVIGREAQGRFIPLFMTIGKLPASKGYCAVMRDITQWKRAEEELTSARQEAERASTHKTEFLARISHEIRTPLNAIIGFSELMAEEKFGPIGNDRYREYLRDIHRSGNHVLALVNDLLDISKIEAGALDLEFEAVALNDALAEAVALMQPQANRERVIIRSSFSAFLPDIVADARSIRQVALNLLSNAIRFTGQGGQVIVSTSYEPNGQVIMRVRDTGIGMSQNELEQALKPFRQVSNHNSQPQNTSNPDVKDWRSQGTGLGLPLTKAMVEANRAQFTIESTPEQGTTVEIAFPPTRVLAE